MSDAGGSPLQGSDAWESAVTANAVDGGVHAAVVQGRDFSGGVHIHHHGPLTRDVDVAVPRMLPGPSARFVNRRQEFGACDRVLAQVGSVGGVAVIVLHGPGGVGKTATAVRWLWQVADQFPDGHLYADLGGDAAASAVLPGEVLPRWLLALGAHPADVPDDPERLQKEYRDRTAGRRMVVLVDNALSVAQVRPLIPACRSGLVVVTSRSRMPRLVASGGYLVEIPPLDGSAAMDLLVDLVGDARTGARTSGSDSASAMRGLAELCAGLPLALCIAGAQLAARPGWPISRLVDRLADDQRRLAQLSVEEDLSMSAVFDVSYQALDPDAARLYRALSVHPGFEFGPGVAAAVMRSTTAEAEDLLTALASVHLLEPASPDHYRFHDLVRLHAREQAEAVEGINGMETALRRMLEWYLDQTVTNDLAVMPLRWRLGPRYFTETGAMRRPGCDRETALRWLEEERTNLLAAVRAAAGHGWDELVWQFCEALWGLYFMRKHFPDWVASHELGVAAAVRCGNGAAEGRMRCQLGFAAFDRRRYGEAAEEFQRALAADRTAGHRRGEATALESVGLVRLAEGRFADAAKLFEQALAMMDESADPRAAALRHHHRGRALSGAGQYPEAAAQLELARKRMQALPDPYNEARVLTSIGENQLRAGHPADAVAPLRAAMQVMVDQRARLQEANVAELLGDAAAGLAREDEARRWWRHAAELLTDLDPDRASGLNLRADHDSGGERDQ